MEKILVSTALSFFLKELSVLEGEIHWVALQAKLDDHINRFFPIKAMDKGLIAFAGFLFKAIQDILSEQTQLATVLEDLTAGDFKGALASLEAMLIAAVPALKNVL